MGYPLVGIVEQDSALPPEMAEVSFDYATIGSDGLYTMLGNVRFVYQGYTVTCSKALYDRAKKSVWLEKNVKIVSEKETFTGEKIALNLATKEFVAADGDTVLATERFAGQLLQPLHLWGRTVEREGEIIRATEGFLTTCEFPKPHFKIGFGRATLIPRKRLILRDARFYKDDKIIFRIGHLVIPIVPDINTTYLPYIGRTTEEGWFVKSAIAYTFGKTLPGLFRVDYMEKKGIGLGTEQVYQEGQSYAGKVSFYNLKDRSTGRTNQNGRVDHQQNLGTFRLGVTTDFQNNSYQSITSNSKTQTTTFSLSQNKARQSTNLSLNLGGSDFSGSSSQTRNYTVTQSLPFGKNGTVNLRYNNNHSDNATGTTKTARDDQTGDISANGTFDKVSVRLQANKNFLNRQSGATGTQSFFSGTERLPDLELGVNTRTLGKSWNRFPFRLAMGFGRFVEGSFTSGASKRVTTDRFLFGATPENKRTPLNRDKSLTFDTNGDFKQTVYPGGDAAQYVLSGNATLSKRMSPQSNIGLTYRYNRPYGGLPIGFRLDQTGESNALGLTSTVRERRTQFSLFTGYDLVRARDKRIAANLRNPWQNLAAQYTYTASPKLTTRFTTTYDLNDHRTIDITNRMQIRAGSFHLDTSTRFDPRVKKYPQTRAQLRTPIGRGMNLTGSVSYNGLTSKFDYRSFTLTKSFHDYEMGLRFIDQPFGFRTERGFSLTVRLKAFPVPLQSNAGQFGTGIDTGLGDIY